MVHVLENPAWHALNSHHAALAQGGGQARRYKPEISIWAGVEENAPAAYAALAENMSPRETVILSTVGDGAAARSAGFDVTLFDGVQMVAEQVAAPEDVSRIVPLGDDDAEEMLTLASMTKPGPYLLKTRLMGDFYGIRHEGRLIAMAGERLKLEGFTEVSGVCTHPDWRGKGFAGLLSRHVAQAIARRGERAFLHAYASNTAAIRLYEQLGFVIRTHVQGGVLVRR